MKTYKFNIISGILLGIPLKIKDAIFRIKCKYGDVITPKTVIDYDVLKVFVDKTDFDINTIKTKLVISCEVTKWEKDVWSKTITPTEIEVKKIILKV